MRARTGCAAAAVRGAGARPGADAAAALQFPITSLREIKILRAMRHPNIVALEDVVVGTKRDDVYLVFEYCRCEAGPGAVRSWAAAARF